jgi:cytochrome c553
MQPAGGSADARDHRGRQAIAMRSGACRRRATVWRRAGVVVVLASALALPTPAWADLGALDDMSRRMQACTPCHGPQGRATPEGFFPRIAGKPAGYLHNQLLNFRDGRRGHAAMVHLVTPLTDAYLREIAVYFSRLRLPYPPPPPARASAERLERGQALALRGDPARRVPACAACHGAALTGARPALPGLLGLSADYIVAQLGAWKTGARRAAAPDCMADIARTLVPEDVAAVAEWLAAQPVPDLGRAIARLPAPMPVRCGSGG